MKRYWVASLVTLFFASASFSGEGPITGPTPPPLPSPSVCPDGCMPKPAPKPKKVPKKPKPKPAPIPAPVPTPKPAPAPKKCEEKTVERVVEKTKYVDREVTVFKRHAVYFLLGRGEGGLVTDRYETKEREGELQVRRSRVGLVGGLMYGYNFSESWSAGAGVFSTLPNTTVMGMLGWHFN